MGASYVDLTAWGREGFETGLRFGYEGHGSAGMGDELGVRANGPGVDWEETAGLSIGQDRE